MTKTRACKGMGQEGSLRITSHVLESVGECEGMNLHTPKWTPTLGVGVSMDFQIFKEQLQRWKPIGKFLEPSCLKWAHMTHLDASNTNYGQKKGQESNW